MEHLSTGDFSLLSFLGVLFGPVFVREPSVSCTHAPLLGLLPSALLNTFRGTRGDPDIRVASLDMEGAKIGLDGMERGLQEAPFYNQEPENQ